MMKISRALIVALLLAAPGCSDDVPAGTESDLRAELSKLREQIAEAKETAQRHKGGRIGELAAMRREILLLSAAMLENRLIANEGGTPTKVVVPELTSNPARAKQIRRHISATEKEVEQARNEADNKEGVAGNLAQATVVTQELTLAQLHLAFYQAAFGLALSGGPDSQMTDTDTTRPGAQSPEGIAPDDARQPGEAPLEKTASVHKEEGTDVAPFEQAEGTAPSGKDAKSSGQEPPPAPATPAKTDGEAPEAGVSAPPDRTKRDDTKDAAVATSAPEPRGGSAARDFSREDYVRIQLLLQEAGFNPGTIDGRWGPQTRGAVADFQQASGLSPTGRPGPATLKALGFN